MLRRVSKSKLGDDDSLRNSEGEEGDSGSSP